LEKAAQQSALFAKSPRYTDLISLESPWPTTRVTVMVHRNQSFELVERVLKPFLAFAGVTADVSYSEYDDSLSFDGDSSADLEVVWLDFNRYSDSPNPLAHWLTQRIATLRTRSSGPILVCDDPADTDDARAFNDAFRMSAEAIPGVYVCEQSHIARSMWDSYVDPRSAAIAGSPLSRQATVLIAQSMGLRWIPAALGVPIKAVVLDLDNTLYTGVLSEDGVDGIVVTDEHRKLQLDLIELGRRGVFLAVASRNDPRDASELLSAGGPLEIHESDLAASVVSWNDKAEGILALAERLRIHPDSMLLVDDNAGELAHVVSETDVRCLHATDPAATRRGLALFPGLFRFRISDEDAARVHDIQASTTRATELAGTTDEAAYRRALGARLRFRMSPGDLVERMHELSTKTNQFNTALHRFTAAEAAQYLGDPDRRVATIALADRLSDSGVVAAIFARRKSSVLHIDEIAISCRALGRQLEGTMILECVRRLLLELPSSSVMVDWRRGPRNGPALDWLATSSSAPLVGDEGSAAIEGPSSAHDGVVIQWDGDASHG
jgi:FkbH-like protein